MQQNSSGVFNFQRLDITPTKVINAYQMCSSNNEVVSYIANSACVASNSPIGRNISLLRYKYDVNINDNLFVNIARINDAQYVSVERQGLINAAIDLFSVQNCHDILNGFTDDMISTVLNKVSIC